MARESSQALLRSDYISWGRAHRASHLVSRPWRIEEAVALVAGDAVRPILGFGLGRSYGDSCLNDGGTLIDCRALDRFVSFDRESGIMVCESGTSLANILTICSKGEADGTFWFPPVCPGTKFITIAGAIANDVHGKNHHAMGTFGSHILWLDLVRSNGRIYRCSLAENSELFRATISGLGLTGLILRAALQLQRVPSLALEAEDIRMDSLDDFYDLSETSCEDWGYTAAWIDCLARGPRLGRGIFTRARHAPIGTKVAPPNERRLTVPVTTPAGLLNRLTLRAFNAAYSRRLLGRWRIARCDRYERIFYPLDSIAQWNRLYGRAGFLQYQCVIPKVAARHAIAALLDRIAHSREGSFLAVLKNFGAAQSPGWLSFPMEGTTLALDFPNRGKVTLDLLEALDDITEDAGGRIYIAKDGRVSAERLQRFYPGLPEFATRVDPAFSSSFWRRVGGPLTAPRVPLVNETVEGEISPLD